MLGPQSTTVRLHLVNNAFNLDPSEPHLYIVKLEFSGVHIIFAFYGVLLIAEEQAGFSRNTFLSSPHLCFITVFIFDLFVSRDDPLMS